MTAQRDPDRLIRAFLDEGLTELPDRTFDAVRMQIDRTRQRAVLGPWRNSPMPAFFRYAAVAAAIALVVVVGAVLVPSGAPGPTSPSPGVTASATPRAAPTFVPSAAERYTWPTRLRAGDYATSFAWNLPFAVAFTMPAGWDSRDVEVIKGDMSVAIELATDLYDDPCAASPGVLDVGTSTADFAGALSTIASLTVSEPVTANFGGAAGTSLTYGAKPGVSCVGEESRLWSSPEWMILPVTPLGSTWWPLRAGEHRLWILDFSGVRFLVDATAGANPTAAAAAELQGILDSLRFVAPTEAYDLGPCTFTLTSPATGDQVSSASVVAMSSTHYPIFAGALPEGFLEPAIDAHIDVRVADISGSGPASMRPSDSVVSPTGSIRGVATLAEESQTVPGSRDLIGTFLLDTPGTWWLRFAVPYAGCAFQQPIVVAPG